MKKALIASVALLLISSSAFASLGYIGLYVDADHSYWCTEGTGFYAAEMWIWCLPGPDGQICAEFAVAYPANIIQSTVTWNDPLISVSLGDLPGGLSVCYVGCQHGWNWPCHQALWVTDPSQTFIQIVPHPEAGAIQFANCLEGYPVEPATVLTNLFINYPPEAPECQGTAVEESSWGAIKGLFE